MEHKRLVVHMLVFRTLDSLKVKRVKSYLVSSPSGKHHRRGIVPDTLNICFYHARWFLHISKKKKIEITYNLYNLLSLSAIQSSALLLPVPANPNRQRQ